MDIESALALYEAGVEIAAIADARADGPGQELSERLVRAGIEVHTGTAVVRALGRGRVKGAVVAELDADGRWIDDTERGIDCDLVAVSGGTVPATSLLLQAGAKARWDEAAGAYLPDEPPPGIYAAGAVAGYSSPEAALASGAVAGAEAALSIGLGGEDDRARLEADRATLSETRHPSTRRCLRPRRGRRGATDAASPACARTSPPTTSPTRSMRGSTHSSS